MDSSRKFEQFLEILRDKLRDDTFLTKKSEQNKLKGVLHETYPELLVKKSVESDVESDEVSQSTKNRGTGAGGHRTNLFGKKFEKITDNEDYLLRIGFKKKYLTSTKTGYYLVGVIDDRKVVFTKQQGFKYYMKEFFDIQCIRCPDETYVIETDTGYIVKILEKKEQRVAGSVDTKLWAGPLLKMEYEDILGENFKVSYAFTLSQYFVDKFKYEQKFILLRKNLKKFNIPIFFKHDAEYFEQIMEWVRCD